MRDLPEGAIAPFNELPLSLNLRQKKYEETNARRRESNRTAII